MFKATGFEYRFRYALHTTIYLIGFLAPWNYAFHLDPPGPNAHLWGILAANLSRMGLGTIADAFNLLLAIAIACACAGAALRTWGAAYLGANVVQSSAMHTFEAGTSNGILQDGPFRYVRNPLYLGTFLHTLALALLMPRSGAIFTIAAIGLLQVRLILAEEGFLTQELGTPYNAYRTLVPRLLPTLRPRVAPAGFQPRWGQALRAETYFWGVTAAYAFAGWRYNASLLVQCVVVAFGVSLVVRALVRTAPQDGAAAGSRFE